MLLLDEPTLEQFRDLTFDSERFVLRLEKKKDERDGKT